MIARGVTDVQLINAGRDAGVRLYQLRPSGKGWRFTLKTDGVPVKKYGRLSTLVNQNGRNRRVPGALCWHGHKAFMEALFDAAPGATLISTLARYNGRKDFMEKYADTYYHNAGSMVAPNYYGSLCDCEVGE